MTGTAASKRWRPCHLHRLQHEHRPLLLDLQLPRLDHRGVRPELRLQQRLVRPAGGGQWEALCQREGSERAALLALPALLALSASGKGKGRDATARVK